MAEQGVGGLGGLALKSALDWEGGMSLGVEEEADPITQDSGYWGGEGRTEVDLSRKVALSVGEGPW